MSTSSDIYNFRYVSYNTTKVSNAKLQLVNFKISKIIFIHKMVLFFNKYDNKCQNIFFIFSFKLRWVIVYGTQCAVEHYNRSCYIVIDSILLKLNCYDLMGKLLKPP